MGSGYPGYEFGRGSPTGCPQADELLDITISMVSLRQSHPKLAKACKDCGKDISSNCVNCEHLLAIKKEQGGE